MFLPFNRMEQRPEERCRDDFIASHHRIRRARELLDIEKDVQRAQREFPKT